MELETASLTDPVEQMPTPSSGRVCIALTASALAASIGWALGLDDAIAYVVEHHPLAFAIGASILLSLAGFLTNTRPGKMIELATTALATALILYGMGSAWLEIISSGHYGDIRFVVAPAPGIAINLAVAALVFCWMRHGKTDLDRKQLRWAIACLPVWISGLAFLFMLSVSCRAHEQASLLAQMEKQIELLTSAAAAPPLPTMPKTHPPIN